MVGSSVTKTQLSNCIDVKELLFEPSVTRVLTPSSHLAESGLLA